MVNWKYIMELLVLSLICFSCSNPKASKAEKEKAAKATSDSLSHADFTLFKSLDKQEILTRLFDNPELDSSGMVTWKTNYIDRLTMSFPLSYDNKYHTSLDKVLYFMDSKKRKCAVAIFSTYYFQYDFLDSSKIRIAGCHACGAPIGVALFHEVNKGWELYDFKKEITHLGWFGTYKTGGRDSGRIQIKEIGNRWSCLSITEGLGGNGGYLEGGEELYSIEEFNLDGSENHPLKNILNNYYSLTESFLARNINPQLRTVIKRVGYYDIIMRTIDNDKIKIKPYKYSQECEKYMEN